MQPIEEFMLGQRKELFHVTLLHYFRSEKILVFFSTCASVEYFSLALSRLLKDRSVTAIHSKKAKRGKAFEGFRKAKQD